MPTKVPGVSAPAGQQDSGWGQPLPGDRWKADQSLPDKPGAIEPLGSPPQAPWLARPETQACPRFLRTSRQF